MIELTTSGVIEALEAQVELEGVDYAYPRADRKCTYVHEGEPDCIVGRVLFEAGVSIERLREADSGGGLSAGSLLSALKAEGVLTFEYHVSLALETAQQHQDSGTPWSIAVDGAKREVGR
jgi:hypothetical protein